MLPPSDDHIVTEQTRNWNAIKNPHLCSMCRDSIVAFLVSAWPELWRFNRASFQCGHYDDFSQLETAASNGCHLCYIILLSITPKDGHMSLPNYCVDPRSYRFIFNVQYDGTFDVYDGRFYVLYRANNGTLYGDLPLIFHTRGVHPPKNYGAKGTIMSMTELGADPASQDAGMSYSQSPTSVGMDIDQATYWIEKCSKTHTTCQSRRTTIFRPTRLLHVSPSDTSAVRLVASEGVPNSITYITLSHRWTDLDNIKLTTSNISDMEKRIVIADSTLR